MALSIPRSVNKIMGWLLGIESLFHSLCVEKIVLEDSEYPRVGTAETLPQGKLYLNMASQMRDCSQLMKSEYICFGLIIHYQSSVMIMRFPCREFD